jgi:D-beta-D-heptose 7-phosphate kinase/D-beta-D-heptose 1-phosphate adenosyltransferase
MTQALIPLNGTILVVGDLMLDRFCVGECSRISPEAPVPVVKITHQTQMPGGAANVANNLAQLGSTVFLLGITGQDEAANLLEKDCQNLKIQTYFIQSKHCQTLIKTRAMAQHQQLLRLDIESQLNQPEALEALHAQYSRLLKSVDLILLSDYGKGTLDRVQDLIIAAKQAQKPVLIDPKGLDFSKYQGATLITPNRKEFCDVAGPYQTLEEFEQKAQTLRENLKLEHLIVTRSEEGLSIFEADQPPCHLPTQAKDVFDVTGAGDTVIATLAAALAKQIPLATAAHWANLAAAIVISQSGTASITHKQLTQAIDNTQIQKTPLFVSSRRKYLSATDARLWIQDKQNQGLKIVMTNGCFDLLHAGHVTYLEEARALGDALIVAINSDASIGRLKGPTRPIQTLEHRWQVLAALSAVDCVVAFDLDTPKELIEQLKPDILVKGADYQIHQIAGADSVLNQGGRVELIELVPEQSTSKIIEKILQSNH